MFTGCRGGNERGTDAAQVDSFYKSAYDDGNAVQNQARQQEGKEYKSTGDLSLLDVALPERLDNQTVHYKSRRWPTREMPKTALTTSLRRTTM